LEKSDGTTALAMELVEGSTLDALPIAKQIAEALEVAHEQGIVHGGLILLGPLAERSIQMSGRVTNLAARELLRWGLSGAMAITLVFCRSRPPLPPDGWDGTPRFVTRPYALRAGRQAD
jgi:hypothetical protein